jgi:hypothetical protein
MGKGFSSSIGWLHTYSACPTEMRRQLVSKWTELVESACLAGARARPFYGIKVWDSIFNDIFSQKKVYSTKHIILVIIITRRLCHIMWPSKWQNLPSQTLMCRRSGWSWGHSVFQGAGNKGESTKFPSSQALRNMKCPPPRWGPPLSILLRNVPPMSQPRRWWCTLPSIMSKGLDDSMVLKVSGW